MRVLIVHHHLHTGGVTKVVQTQIQALKEQGIQVECLVGTQPELNIDAKVHCLEELNYLDPQWTPSDWTQHYHTIKHKISSLVDQDKGDLIHVHNLNLGKNPIVTLAIHDLAKEGYSVLNHCHDFAEDDRPENMKRLKDVLEGGFKQNMKDIMYPQIPSYNFAVINQKDRQRLLDLAYTDHKVLYLANAIAQPYFKHDDQQRSRTYQALNLSEDKALIVYPVRAIRRKNIGEFILLASLFSDRAHWLITQAPKNPIEYEAYQNWVRFCTEQNIQVCFEAGQKADFDDLMSSADRMITTSIAEGFGLSFLEPWLYGKAVVGRDIPEITKDFKSLGIQLGHFYENLNIDQDTDFSQLEEEEKRLFIVRLKQEPSLAEEWRHKEAFQFLFKPFADHEVSHNASKIEKYFSLKAYGQTLQKFYESAF